MSLARTSSNLSISYFIHSAHLITESKTEHTVGAQHIVVVDR